MDTQAPGSVEAFKHQHDFQFTIRESALGMTGPWKKGMIIISRLSEPGAVGVVCRENSVVPISSARISENSNKKKP